MSSALVPMHLGSLHAYETALLALLAFGPFVVLAVVVVVMRRRDVDESELGAGDEPGARAAVRRASERSAKGGSAG